MRIRLRAAHLVPVVAAPRANGWVDIEDGRIVAVDDGRAEPPPVDQEMDLGQVALLPGLVNAHTHLELSHLHGAVPPAGHFLEWVRTMLAARAEAQAGPAIVEAIERAIEAMRATGTLACGDIGNTEAALPVLAASGLEAVHFLEVLGFRADGAGQRGADAWQRAVTWPDASAPAHVRRGVAAHAPYSTAPALIAAVVAGLDADPGRRSSIHLGESPEELVFLSTGGGPWRTLLEDVGTWEPRWRAPACTPVEYLARLGALHPRLLVVHGTHLSDEDLHRLAAAGCTLVLCARSNRWVGVGDPPLARCVAAQVRLAIGTDSLASVSDLDLFAELAHLRGLDTRVDASHLVHAATRGGALALGLDDLGGIAPGMRAALLIVRVPPETDDVQEWLVSGKIRPADVEWLQARLASSGRAASLTR
jgi:aminodeoxyfutalosine deaminase